MVTSSIVMKNIGPVDEAVFPLSPDFYYLIGDNEQGKSRALAAMKRALGSDDKVVLRRGEISGYVRGIGRDLTQSEGRTTPGKGELTVYSIEAIDPSKIIDTGHVDPVRADKERIARWTELAMVPMDFAPLMALVGGADAFKTLASPDTVAATSMLDAVASFKKDLDEHANQTGKAAEREEALADGIRQTIGNVDFAQEHDETTLARATEEAINAKGELEGRAKAAAETSQKLGSTRTLLDELRAGPKIDEEAARAEVEAARAAEADANTALGGAAEAVKAAEAAKAEAIRQADLAIAAAKQRQGDAALALTTAQATTRRAQAALDALAKRRADIAKAELEVSQLGGSIVEAPAPEALEEARVKVAQARVAQDRGVVIRLALKQRADADEAAKRAATWRERTQLLRSWAAATWDVLAQALRAYLPEGMTIEDARLVMRQGGHKFYFDELSDGRKARIVMTAAARTAKAAAAAEAKASGKPERMPLLVFDQPFGESMPPSKRKELRDLCRELGVCLYSAHYAEGPLRVAKVNADGEFEEVSNGAHAA